MKREMTAEEKRILKIFQSFPVTSHLAIANTLLTFLKLRSRRPIEKKKRLYTLQHDCCKVKSNRPLVSNPRPGGKIRPATFFLFLFFVARESKWCVSTRTILAKIDTEMSNRHVLSITLRLNSSVTMLTLPRTITDQTIMVDFKLVIHQFVADSSNRDEAMKDLFAVSVLTALRENTSLRSGM